MPNAGSGGAPARVKAVIERDERYLLALHNNHLPENKGKWTFVGGLIDPTNASPEDALLRELREELAVEGRVLGSVGTFPYRDHACRVLAADFDGEPRPDPAEILALRWFTRHEIEGIAQANLLHMGFEVEALGQALGRAPVPVSDAGARRFVDPLGAEVPFDGTSPVRWYLAANVLVVRDGKVLMVRQTPQWGGRWELPGGGLEPGESLLEGAARECDEETGYRFVAGSPVPVHVEEAWFTGGWGTYAHAVIFVFQGKVAGDLDPEWTQDHGEIVEIAWIDPKDLSAATTRSIHWPALQKAGLV